MRPFSLAICALLLTATGCAGFKLVTVEEQQIVEAVLETPPFSSPLTIDVESHLPRTCGEKIAREGSSVWPRLIEAGLATMKPENLNGTAGCALVPVGKAARADDQLTWQSVEHGERWRIPVGMYGINGSNEDLVHMTRSLTGTPSVSFPWTFHSFNRLQRAIAAQKVPGQGALAGTAKAELVRTADGWKVVSLSMAPSI
jgi:hypothetical protein